MSAAHSESRNLFCSNNVVPNKYVECPNGLYVHYGVGHNMDAQKDSDYTKRRNKMVERQIASRGIQNPRVLDAMRSVPRHRFVPEGQNLAAYDDKPLSIGYGQTISQPYIVALMTEMCDLRGEEKVLEVGTGSGYQTAILASLAGEVFSIEIYESLSKRAQKILDELGYDNVHLIVGSGFDGVPSEAPFDAIILTASPSAIPQTLIDQLADGGVLVGPEGSISQRLVKIEKQFGQISKKTICSVAFVPMVDK